MLSFENYALYGMYKLWNDFCTATSWTIAAAVRRSGWYINTDSTETTGETIW